MDFVYERLRNWFKSNIGVSFLINLCFLILVILFCDMKYEVSDDFVVDAVLSGAYGDTYDAHLLFSNIILGYFLKFLYLLIPVVSWYFVFQILVSFLSLWAISYIVLEKNNRTLGILLCIVFISFFSDDLYILVQFTKTATVACCAGGSLFLYGFWNENNRSYLCIILGTILALVGSMIRFNCMYIALVFLFLIFLKYIWEYRKQAKGNALIKQISFGMIACFILIGGAFALRYINISIWNSDEEYAFYREYNSLRSSVTDTKGYGYESIADELSNLGLSETDYYMLSSWNFMDQDYFTEDILESVAEIKQDYNANARSVRNTLKQFRDRHYENYIIAIGIVILFALLLFINPLRVPWEILEFGVCVLLLLYFFWIGRVVYRVEYSIFLCMGISLVTAFSKKQISRTSQNIFLCLSILFCVLKVPLYIPDMSYKTMTNEEYEQYIYDVFYSSGTFDIKKYRCNVNSRRPYGGLTDYIEKDNDSYYLLDFNTTIQLIYYNYKPWIRMPIGYWKNYYTYLGGVTSGFPGNSSVWEDHGIDPQNPFESLANGDVYVIDNKNYNYKLKYLQERYYPNAKLELIDTIDGFEIWQYYKE